MEQQRNLYYVVTMKTYFGIYMSWSPRALVGCNNENLKIFDFFTKAYEYIKILLLQNDKKKSKFYAIQNGKEIGVFFSWDVCKQFTNGFPNAKFKSFDDIEDARKFVEGNKLDVMTMSNKSKPMVNSTPFLNSCTKEVKSNKRNQKIKENVQVEEMNLKIENKTVKLYVDQAEKDRICVYTDGACENNGNNEAKAGLGVYWHDESNWNLSVKFTGKQTNNEAELNAILCAIQIAHSHGIKKLRILSDSKFSIQCMTEFIKTWRKNGYKCQTGKEVKNKETLTKIDRFIKETEINVTYAYVKAHANNRGNNKADELARNGVRK